MLVNDTTVVKLGLGNISKDHPMEMLLFPPTIGSQFSATRIDHCYTITTKEFKSFQVNNIKSYFGIYLITDILQLKTSPDTKARTKD